MNITTAAGPDSTGRHTGGVGYNPYRKFRASTFDYVMVGAAVAVCLALVAWALLG